MRPFLGPAAPWKGWNPPASPAQCQGHQLLPHVLTSLAPGSLGLHTDLARQESGAAAPAPAVHAVLQHQPDGSAQWTTCLSPVRLVTVNTPSTMHVGVQAPSLPT